MIATRRFLTKFRSAAAVRLAGDPDLYLKIPAGPSYDGFASCFANFVPGPEAAVLGAVQRPLALGGGATRSFLQDGDRVTLSGWCQGEGYRVGFGEVSGEILPPA